MQGPRKPVIAFAAVAVAAGLAVAGCGSGSDSGTSGDPVLTVYLSAPMSGPDAGDGIDVAGGARAALKDAGNQAGGTEVSVEVLDDAGRSGATDALAGANARVATEDSTAIAYIGEVDSGTTRTSLPITNEAGLLQVSPGASAVDLTRSAPGSDQIPQEVQPSGTRTFGRVIPSDTLQGAAAAVALSRSPGVRAVWAFGRSSTYGDALLDGYGSVSGSPEIAEQGGEAGGVYAISPRPEVGLTETVAAASMVYGADAQIAGSPPETTMPEGSVLISGPMAPSQLPDGDAAESGRSGAGRFWAYGYEAMAVVLDSIDRAGDPLDRGSVVDAFFATTDRDSILGTYSIDDVGDTTLSEVGTYRADGDGALTPAPEPISVP